MFWSVISLLATGLILTIGLATLSGFFAGVHQAKVSNRTVSSATPKEVPLTMEERENAQTILNKLRRTQDKVTGTTWLKPSWVEGYQHQLYLYIGLTEAGEAFLRLKIEYKGEEMLMIRKFVFRIDDTVETVEPTGLLKSDFVADDYREWFDEPADPHLDLVQQVANGNKVLFRCQGDKQHFDRTIRVDEKQSLREMLLAYRYLKESTRNAPTSH